MMSLLKILIPVSVVIVVMVTISTIVVLIKSEALQTDPVVNTTVGLVRGLRGDDGTTMFLGIPYSIVDKKNPFGEAIPNPTFADVFNAFNDNIRCPQLQNLSSSSLDCLHVNIHVPATVKKKLPVFVYIYGGEYMYGACGRSTYGLKFLMRHNIIFVCFNYRTTAYGFLCLHTPELPGNQGLKDQLNALRWIKNNIKAFGGDDENITIVGNSAGAASVDFQLYYADEGLFQKVISLSGTSLDAVAFQKEDVNAAFKIAKNLGLETYNLSEAITFLSNHTPSQVLLAAETLQMTFGPCIEKKFPNVKGFITRHPVSTPFAKARNVTILYGYTDNEQSPYVNMSAPEIVDIFNDLNTTFQFGSNYDTMKTIVRQFYTGDEPISLSQKQALIDFKSDLRYLHPIQRTLAKYLEHGGKAYHYVFSYVGDRNVWRLHYNITEGGAVHADDLGYLFESPKLKDTPTPDDQLMIDRITTLLTNFAKYGDPTPSPTELLPVRWLPITKDKLIYLNISRILTLGTRPFHQRLSFWDLFYRTNREYVRGYSKDISWDNI